MKRKEKEMTTTQEKRKRGRPTRDEYTNISVTLREEDIARVRLAVSARKTTVSDVMAKCIKSYLNGGRGETEAVLKSKLERIKRILESDN